MSFQTHVDDDVSVVLVVVRRVEHQNGTAQVDAPGGTNGVMGCRAVSPA